MDYNKIISVLDSISTINDEQKAALLEAKIQLSKEIPKEVIIDTTNMDENCNDYFYKCPLCDCTVFDENEQTGRCNCGQTLMLPNITEWLEQFETSHKYNFKTGKWYKKRKRLKKV